MAILYLMVGIQGSGKSTFSKRLSKEKNCKIISSDEVRKMYPNLEEKNVFPEVYRLCAEELKNNRDVIFDATNITPNVRNRNITNIKSIFSDFKIHVYFINTDVEICKTRVEKRNKQENEIFIPLEVIDSYSKNIIPPSKEEGFEEIIVLNNYQEENYHE